MVVLEAMSNARASDSCLCATDVVGFVCDLSFAFDFDGA